MMTRRVLIVRLTLIEVLHWLSIASFTAFALAYLQNVRGVTDGEAGMLILLMTIGAVIGQFFWGAACDRLGTHKGTFLAACLMQAPLCFALFYAKNPLLLGVCYAALGFVQNAMPANIDTWVLKSFSDDPKIFGSVRAAAALAFALFTLVYGRIIDALGYPVMLIVTTTFIALGALVALTTPDAHCTRAKGAPRASMRALASREYMTLLFVLLLTGVCGSTFQILAMLMKHAGGTVRHLGLSMFLSGMVQVPLMFFGGRMTRLTPRVRMIIGGGFYIATVLLFAAARQPAHAVIANTLSGVGYALIMPAMRQWVYELSTPETRTTAQGAADAALVSLGSMIGAGAVGALADGVGMPPILIAFAAAQAVGLLPLLLGMRLRRG
jgi:PPP family 3-phenylpropionic acid transporter